MWRGVIGAAIFLLGALWASGPAAAGQIYVVRTGDTLWRISHHLGVRPTDLATANHLALTDTIHPGLRLAVPGAAPAVADPVAPPLSSGAARIAAGLLGRPYQWSGIGNRGFDCSGLVAHVFSALGRPLPRSSFALYALGTLVSRWALAPGDLVFFRTYSAGASHVGIYIGDSRFIHASYSRGVVISSIEESYYRDRFLGGRRI